MTVWVWCTRTKRQMKHLHHQNLQQHTTEIQALVLSKASNYWRRDQAAFGNMMLSSSSESRLPWRRDGTISLSRLASDITAPIFSYNNMFWFSHKSVLVFLNFVESKCHQCYLYLCAEVQKLPLKENIKDSGWVINDMSLNIWKCVDVGVIENGSILGFWFETWYVNSNPQLWW